MAASTLVQKPGTAGCVADTNANAQCTAGVALGNANELVVSPDGQNVYVAAEFSDAVAVFDRAAGGALTQKAGTAGCVAAPDAGFGLPPGACATGIGLKGAEAIAISPDARNVYVGSFLGDAVAVFDRAADGTLTQKAGLAACVSDTGSGPCADGTGLDRVAAVTVSSDGRSVYAAGEDSDTIAVFDRAADGTIAQKPGVAGCVSDTGAGPCLDGAALDDIVQLAMSPDGRSIYATAFSGNAVAVLDRGLDGSLAQKAGAAGCVSETTAAGCAFAKALHGTRSVTVSPDGATLYVAVPGSAAVAVFDRGTDGALTQKAGSAGCISGNETGGACTPGRGLSGAASVAVSPDGASVYVPTMSLGLYGGIIERFSGQLTILDRAADGTLTQAAGPAGCVSENGTGGTCADGTAVDGVTDAAVSPDGRNVYVAGYAAAAVLIFDRTSTPRPAADVTPPLLRKLKFSPNRFRALARGGAVVTRGGGRISYRLSEPASVVFGVQRAIGGRRVGGRCLAARASNRSARRCDRYRDVTGNFRQAGATGRNTLRFSGRLRKRALAAGRYRLAAIAGDAAGNKSTVQVVRFTIVRR